MKFNKALQKEITDPSIDLATDYSEIAIDQLLENEVISELPIIKTLVAATKIVIGIRDRKFIKNFFCFLKEFHSRKIEKKKLNEFKKRFGSDLKYQGKIMDGILIYNDQFLSAEKSIIMGRLFANHIEGEFDWITFMELCFCLDKLNPKAYSFFKIMEQEHNWSMPFDSSKVKFDLEALFFSAGIGHRMNARFDVTKLGQQLYLYGIKES